MSSIYDLFPTPSYSGKGLSVNTGNAGGIGLTNSVTTGGIMMPNNVSDFLYKSKTSNLDDLGGLGKTGGFFGNGNDLGLNFDTAKFGLGGIMGIMNILNASKAMKLADAQIDLGRKNYAMQEQAYNTNQAQRGRMIANMGTANPTEAYLQSAEQKYLDRYGSGGLIAKKELAPKQTA